MMIQSNEEMLEKIRLDRPNQVINEVKSFHMNKSGFYNVLVDMESMFFDTKILHSTVTLPYPSIEYDNLSQKEQLAFRWGEII